MTIDNKRLAALDAHFMLSQAGQEARVAMAHIADLPAGIPVTPAETRLRGFMSLSIQPMDEASV